MVDGRLEGLAARAVVVIGADGNVTHSALVPEIAQEPDYYAAIAARVIGTVIVTVAAG